MPELNDPDVGLEFFSKYLNYDPSTGIFTHAINRSGRYARKGSIAGTPHDEYIRLNICGYLVLAHRMAWLFVYGVWPSTRLDHVDRDGTHNWIENLRPCSHSQNMANKKRQYNNKVGLKGVSWDKKSNKWRSQLSKNGAKINLGWFDDPQKAHEVYIDAAQKYHGEFARAE